MKNLFLPSVQNGYIYENAAEVVEEVIFLKNSLEENDDQFLKSVELEWKIKIKRFEQFKPQIELEIGGHNNQEALETGNDVLIQEYSDKIQNSSQPITTQSSTKWISFVFLPMEKNSLVLATEDDQKFSHGSKYCNETKIAKNSTEFIFESSDENNNEEDFDIDDFLKHCSSTHLLSSS